jgi:hypothetical protein
MLEDDCATTCAAGEGGDWEVSVVKKPARNMIISRNDNLLSSFKSQISPFPHATTSIVTFDL